MFQESVTRTNFDVGGSQHNCDKPIQSGTNLYGSDGNPTKHNLDIKITLDGFGASFRNYYLRTITDVYEGTQTICGTILNRNTVPN